MEGSLSEERRIIEGELRRADLRAGPEYVDEGVQLPTEARDVVLIPSAVVLGRTDAEPRSPRAEGGEELRAEGDMGGYEILERLPVLRVLEPLGYVVEEEPEGPYPQILTWRSFRSRASISRPAL